VAQDSTLPAPPTEDELPIPTLEIERIPPNTSYEFALQFSYGAITYFRDEVPPWIGFGARGGWGKNWGNHRLGPDFTATAEGPIGIHTTLSFEPKLNWDFVGNKGVLLGAGVGPAVMYHIESDTIFPEKTLGFAPVAAFRVGWSQGFSRVGRRLFFFVEPKLRYVDGALNPLVAFAVGSGKGA
jgi:hypothetical protein